MSFRIYNVLNLNNIVYFITGKVISKPLGRGGAVKVGEEKDESLTHLMTTVFVEQPLALPLSAKKWFEIMTCLVAIHL